MTSSLFYDQVGGKVCSGENKNVRMFAEHIQETGMKLGYTKMASFFDEDYESKDR